MSTDSDPNRIVIRKEDLWDAPVEAPGLALDIVITAGDLQVLTISAEDLAQVHVPESSILVVTATDLAEFERQMLRVNPDDLPPLIHLRLKDLPSIMRIGLEELPSDLSGATTECYHGTSSANAERICKEGFRVGPGAALGAGIYFSVGAIGVARSFARGGFGLIRARVHWGKVAYLDDPKTPAKFKGGGEAVTRAALAEGYQSFLQSSKYSQQQPTIGVVLGTIGSYIRDGRIEVLELIEPLLQQRKVIQNRTYTMLC